MTGKIIRPAPAEIEFREHAFPHLRAAPGREYGDLYPYPDIEHKVTHLVCATDPTYKLTNWLSGVSVWSYRSRRVSAQSGDRGQWLSLVNKEFQDDPETWGTLRDQGWAGPSLVSRGAFIELGMKYEDAVELIRKKRGAINTKQLETWRSTRGRNTFPRQEQVPDFSKR